MKMLLPLLFTLLTISHSSHANVLPEDPHIYVEGYAEKEVLPDEIALTIAIHATNIATEAAKAEVDDKSLQLLEAMKTLAIDKTDISASPLQIAPAYEYVSGKRRLTGSKVSRNVTIIIKDLALYPNVNQALVNAKITASVSSKAIISNQRAIIKELQQLALKDAKQSAQDLAQLQGTAIDNIHSISEFNSRLNDAVALLPTNQAYNQTTKVATSNLSVGSQNGIFEINKITLSAKLYVVYTLKD